MTGDKEQELDTSVYYFERTELSGKSTVELKKSTVKEWNKLSKENGKRVVIATRDHLDSVGLVNIGGFKPKFPIKVLISEDKTSDPFAGNEIVDVEEYIKKKEAHFVSEELEYRHAINTLNIHWILDKSIIKPTNGDLRKKALNNFERFKQGIAEDRKLLRIKLQNTTLDQQVLSYATKTYHQPQVTLITNYAKFLKENTIDNHKALVDSLNSASKWYKSAKTQQAITALQFLLLSSMLAAAIAVELVYLHSGKLDVNIDIMLGCLAFIFGISGVVKINQVVQSRSIQKHYDNTRDTLFAPKESIKLNKIQLISIDDLKDGAKSLPTFEELNLKDSNISTLVKRSNQHFFYNPVSHKIHEIGSELLESQLRIRAINFPHIYEDAKVISNKEHCDYIISQINSPPADDSESQTLMSSS